MPRYSPERRPDFSFSSFWPTRGSSRSRSSCSHCDELQREVNEYKRIHRENEVIFQHLKQHESELKSYIDMLEGRMELVTERRQIRLRSRSTGFEF
jgi:hypothetical protein